VATFGEAPEPMFAQIRAYTGPLDEAGEPHDQAPKAAAECAANIAGTPRCVYANGEVGISLSDVGDIEYVAVYAQWLVTPDAANPEAPIGSEVYASWLFHLDP
jgi:hypothetical protein